MIVPLLTPDLTPIYAFPIILGVSFLSCIIGSLTTQPDDMEVLKNFYLKVRPWGFWKPVYEALVIDHPEIQPNRDFKRDMFNVGVGIIWQTALTATGIYLVLEEYLYLSIAVSITLVASIILKYNWYDKLENHPSDISIIEKV